MTGELSSLSPAQLAGQLIVGGYEEPSPPVELQRALARGERAGVILFRRNLPGELSGLLETQELSQRIAAWLPPELPGLIALDEEGGRVARLSPPALRLPPARALASQWGPSGVKAVAQVLGRELRALGFTLNFAPVVDVDTNPDNPIIGDRAFGSSVSAVVQCGQAYLEGLSQAGVAACLKHFPGHGDTDLDSHLALPAVRHPLARLSAVELIPFAALARRCPAVMSAHVVCHALDARAPATLSVAALRCWLRGRLGFDGVIFSDALDMRAIADHHGIGEAAVLAVRAGCDIVLPCRSQEDQSLVHEALCRHIVSDAGFRLLAECAAQRSLALRRAHPIMPSSSAALQELLQGPVASMQAELERIMLPRDAAAAGAAAGRA